MVELSTSKFCCIVYAWRHVTCCRRFRRYQLNHSFSHDVLQSIALGPELGLFATTRQTSCDQQSPPWIPRKCALVCGTTIVLGANSDSATHSLQTHSKSSQFPIDQLSLAERVLLKISITLIQPEMLCLSQTMAIFFVRFLSQHTFLLHAVRPGKSVRQHLLQVHRPIFYLAHRNRNPQFEFARLHLAAARLTTIDLAEFLSQALSFYIYQADIPSPHVTQWCDILRRLDYQSTTLYNFGQVILEVGHFTALGGSSSLYMPRRSEVECVYKDFIYIFDWTFISYQLGALAFSSKESWFLPEPWISLPLPYS